MKFHLIYSLTVLILFSSSAEAVSFLQSFQSALVKNEDIAQGDQAVRQAREQVRIARGTVMPQVTLNASKTWQDEPKNAFAQGFSPETQESASINVKQPIFSGFRDFHGYDNRKRLLEAAEANAALNQVKLYIEVGKSYYQILSYEQDLKNLREQVGLYGQRVKDLQGRTRRGESNVTEALTAQSTQASLEADIQLVTGQLANERENFAFLTGLPANTVLDDSAMKGAELQKPLQKIEDYLARVEDRPDIKAALKLKSAAESQTRFMKGGHWPTISAEGNYYLKQPIVFLEDIKWDAKISASVPIFNGGVTNANVRDAAAQESTAALELAKLRREAHKEIRSYYDSVRVRLAQVAALEKTVGLAEKNYQVLQKEFRNGLVRSIDAQVALTEFRVARRTFDQARYLAQIDLIGLEASSFMVPLISEKGKQ